MLVSSVVESLTLSRTIATPVIYYYCDYAERISLQPAIILGTLIGSLLSGHGKIPEEIADLVQKFYQDGERTPDTHEVLSILLGLVELSKKVTLVLDGIDEVNEKNFHILLSSLRTLLFHPGVAVKIFLTSREYKDIFSILSPMSEMWFQIHLDQLATSHDIESYIRYSVDELMVSKRSIINSSHIEIKDEIIQRLIEGANGM